MRVCLGQINTTPGDFAGNAAAIRTGIDEALAADADLLVFPELTIPGYLSQDLMYHTGFIDRNLEVLRDICAYTQGKSERLHVIVGYIERNPGAGKPWFNKAAVITNGRIIGDYAKQLLPFYDVFDELRYFEPGTELCVVSIAGKKVGITICEDLWNDKGSDDYNYVNNPMDQYRRAGVELVVSLNSSPWVQDKLWQRLKVIAPGTEDGPDLIYVNQWGGQDELVFDGQSFVLSKGDLIHLETDVSGNRFPVVSLPLAQPFLSQVARPGNRQSVLKRSVSLYDMVVLGLRDYALKSGFSQMVLASSGGVDSAVVCKIACDAIGAGNVHAIRMPSVFSSSHSVDDALELHRNLGCWDYEVPVEHESVVAMLNQHYQRYDNDEANLVARKMQAGQYARVADENMQARLRDLYVMHFSNAYGAMPLSTGNKTESACGYYTHFDMNFSYAPIKDLYKYQVMDIARAAPEIPDHIWQKPPSAELAPGQIDEESLLPYGVLDAIVRAYIEDYVSTLDQFEHWFDMHQKADLRVSGDHSVLSRWISHGDARRDYDRIISLMGKMEYKRRQTCPGTKVSKVAFGIGRRIPIVEKWS
ncbi:MAG: NAD(+) synthase [Pseudomonadales bacterium]|nr:NAD(+) synthase [Pseudomonadales bacterium]